MDFDEEYASRLELVSEAFLKAGWCPPTFCTPRQFSDLEALGPDLGKEELAQAIYSRIRGFTLHPDYTARLTYIWSSKARLKALAPLIDEAILCLYSGQFNASAVTFVAAIEGAICRMVDKKIMAKNAIGALQTLTFYCLHARGEVLKSLLIQVCENWFFRDTRHNENTLDYSSLNRHNLAHGLVQGRMLGERDVLRAMLVAETIAELERCRSGEDHTLYPAPPDEDTFSLLCLSYRKSFLRLESLRDTQRVISLDSQSVRSEPEQPFGCFSDDFDAPPLTIRDNHPEVAAVHKKLLARGFGPYAN